mmetsp:Transcript_53346/g.95747  ORF Transcript_53346/g.95747 Transcript_53346/m.95747 type:complete len:436 (+) Transcript_53346:133-1440(+)
MALVEDLVANFRLFSICFAVVHGALGAMLQYATSLLPDGCGSTGNGIFYAMSVVSSLLLALPALMLLGRKGCTLIGFILYSLYAALFTIALMLPAGRDEACGSGSYLFWLGSCCGGCGAGLLWTAQGSYFSRTTFLLNQAGLQDQGVSLAGMFAGIYLLGEFLLKALYTVFDYIFPSLSYLSTTACLCLASVVASAVATFLDPLKEESAKHDLHSDRVGQMTLQKISDFISLWRSPLIWLLSPTNIAFGFGSAYLNGAFNQYVAAPSVGVGPLGAFGAMTVLSAALSSQAYSRLGTSFGNGLPLALGSVAMVAAAAIGSTNCTGWGYWIVVVYIIWGFGRGSYESTNRAIMNDAYLPEDVDAAFANFTFQQCVAASAAYFVNSTVLSVIATAGFAAASVPAYAAAKRWFSQHDREDESEQMNLLSQAPAIGRLAS